MSTNEPTQPVVTVEATIVEMVRAMAVMGQALAARVESHRSAAAANRLGEHKVLLEQSLEAAYVQNADLREKLGEVNAKLVTAEDRLANVQREWRAAVVLVGEGHAARDAAVAELAGVKGERDDARKERDEARLNRDDVASLKLMLGAAMQKAEQARAELDGVKRERELARAERDSHMKSNARLLDATSTASNELRHALEFAEEPVVARGAVVAAYRRLCAVLGLEPKDF